MNLDNISSLIMNGVESAAQMSIGQAILRLVDRILWIIEKSVQWSLPTADDTTEENGKSFGKVELVRPLPWIFFLPSLLVLRMVRFSLNVAANVLGYPTVEPSDMVRVIQRGRRRLRAIKSSGLKNMRQKKTPVVKVSSTPEERIVRESTPTSEDPHSKRKFSEISIDSSESSESEEEPLLQKLDRLANDSGTDEEYSPDETSDATDSSDSEADLSISMSEVQEALKEAEKDKFMKTSPVKNPDSANKVDDTEQHKTENEEKPDARPTKPQQVSVTTENNNTTEENNTEKNCLTTNGVNNEQDAAYYSPISWKSVSPELGLSPEKQDNQIDFEGKPEELNNGEVNEKDRKTYDSNQVGEEVTNGHMKEKQRIRLHSSGSNKHHHQKNKRGNHGNRKKK